MTHDNLVGELWIIFYDCQIVDRISHLTPRLPVIVANQDYKVPQL